MKKKRWPKIVLAVIVILIVTWFLGPKPEKPELKTELPKVEVALDDLSEWLWLESKDLKIRPGNESQLVWNDSVPSKTEYAILYLHGFSASPMEGQPFLDNTAKALGMNYYAPLLYGHGLETEEALIDMYPDSLWNSTLRAYAVAKLLGIKVIVVGTSTGATLALKLAAEFDLEALVLLSPNVQVNHPSAGLLSGPWGLQLARIVTGSKYRDIHFNEEYTKYWYTHYRLEGTVFLGVLLDATMQEETFRKVEEPVFVGAYYKDETHQDPVVKVSAMRWMFDHLSSVQKHFVEFPKAENHVLGSDITCKDVESVQREVVRFVEEVVVKK